METLQKMVEELTALLALADSEARDLTDEEVDRCAELNTKIAAAKEREEVQKRSREFLAPTGAPAFLRTVGDDKAEMRAFEHYLRTGQQNSDLIRTRAQSEAVGSEGGFLVPTEMRDRIVERMVAFGGFAPEAENMTTSTGAPLEWPTLDDTANVGAITPEGAQFTGGADLVFGTASLGAYKYTSNGASNEPLRVSVELLQDSNFDIVNLVTRALGTRIARAQAAHWVTGTGAGQPQGFAGSSITEDADVDVHDVVDYDDLLDLETLLDPAYEQNAKWVMSKATWNVVRSIVDGDQRPLIFDSAASGIAGRPAKQLLGYPVIIDQAMPGFPGAGDEHFIALGDWREAYVIRHVANLTIIVNPYTRANFGQVEYVAWERADGVVQNRNAYVLMANTAS